ncbi:hypothetical protein GGS20DRAFT_585244 [Poronia punctata]|nr:hypothetical protein GGS20DRAFT_585244 [Poronia punctata]
MSIAGARAIESNVSGPSPQWDRRSTKSRHHKQTAQPEVIVLDPESPDESGQGDGVDEYSVITSMFPNICLKYMAELLTQLHYNIDAVVSAILDKVERGQAYPTEPPLQSGSLKRKRSIGSETVSTENLLGLSLDPGTVDDSEAERRKRTQQNIVTMRAKLITRAHDVMFNSREYKTLGQQLLSQDFPCARLDYLKRMIATCGGSVFEAYLFMAEHVRDRDQAPLPWPEKKKATEIQAKYTPKGIKCLEMSPYSAEEQAALAEFIAAREIAAQLDHEKEERVNVEMAKENNQMVECGICYEDCALNRMVQCGGEPAHLFCRDCMRSQAKSLIGMGKYQLTCVSIDGCTAGFSAAERDKFIGKNSITALDRLEQEDVLRMAGIEDLETCPFCPYAAEYPAIDVNKEFRCDSPTCGQVSCRLCRKTSHIPKTCAEMSADSSLEARHKLEEAMSEALIRRCNKCKNPFVKVDGCNKIQCTKCRTVQCDVCRKTITDYSHFDNTSRGGKKGQCPLFDSSEERYAKEVSLAEVETRKKVVEQNPEVDEEALRIVMPPSNKAAKPTRNHAGVPAPDAALDGYPADFNPWEGPWGRHHMPIPMPIPMHMRMPMHMPMHMGPGMPIPPRAYRLEDGLEDAFNQNRELLNAAFPLPLPYPVLDLAPFEPDFDQHEYLPVDHERDYYVPPPRGPHNQGLPEKRTAPKAPTHEPANV